MAASLRRRCNRRLIIDTDPLMTAVWSDMLLGRRDPWFDQWRGRADLYLLLEAGLPWVDDGTRVFDGPAERARFAAACRADLDARGVRWAVVSGRGEARVAAALAVIAAAGL